MIENIKRKKRCVIIAFLIPALTMLIAYIANGVYPFGDHGVLIIDSLHQYLPFFTDFHEKLTNGESLLYSFGGGLGYNMWATIAYYLASPLNLLMVIVPMSHVMDFMAYLILLKISLAGAAFAWYLADRNDGADYMPIPFACMFALGTFMIGYYFNIMWLDSVMVLPLVMKGIEKIVDGKSGVLFGTSLFYGLWCNYYIGYMLCLFSCLYFLALWVGVRKAKVLSFIKSGLRFAWYGLLSGGMAAVLLIPAYLALGMTESAGSSFPSKIKFYTDFITQWTGHFALVEPINIYDDQSGVNIYCGVIVMILFFLYMLDREIDFLKRVSKVVLAGLFLLSMNFNMLNYIWHGFHTQNGLPNRFAFLYIGLILTMGFDALRDIRKYHPMRIALAWLIPMAFTAFCGWQNVGEREWYVYAVTVLLLTLYGVLLMLLRGMQAEPKKLKIVLAAAMSLEMAATGIYGVCMNGTVGRSTYVDEQTAYQTMIARQEEAESTADGDDGTDNTVSEKIDGNTAGSGSDTDSIAESTETKSTDSGFYRSEIDSQRMRNENMFMGANGLVLFSSTMPEATVNLCKAIGMEARTNKTGYNGVTKLFNDVFGIRYVVGKSGEATLYQMTKVDEEGSLSLYENEGALSLGFMVSSNIKKWEIEDQLAMKVQSDFAELATGETFFYTLRESYSLEEGPTYIIRLHPGEQTYIEFTENVKSLTIKTPQYEKTINNFTTNVFNLGTVTEDTKANITITYKEGNTEPVPVRVYTCTDEEYQAVYDKLAQNQMENVEVSGDHVSGTIHVDTAGTLLLTIPYDDGWTIKVNGETAEQYRVGEALTGIDLSEGDYEIEMTFVPQGFQMGLLITLICIALFILSCFGEKKIAKVQAERQEKRRREQEEAEAELDEDYEIDYE